MTWPRQDVGLFCESIDDPVIAMEDFPNIFPRRFRHDSAGTRERL
jgi:hypothetical protein